MTSGLDIRWRLLSIHTNGRPTSEWLSHTPKERCVCVCGVVCVDVMWCGVMWMCVCVCEWMWVCICVCILWCPWWCCIYMSMTMMCPWWCIHDDDVLMSNGDDVGGFFDDRWKPVYISVRVLYHHTNTDTAQAIHAHAHSLVGTAGWVALLLKYGK